MSVNTPMKSRFHIILYEIEEHKVMLSYCEYHSKTAGLILTDTDSVSAPSWDHFWDQHSPSAIIFIEYINRLFKDLSNIDKWNTMIYMQDIYYADLWSNTSKPGQLYLAKPK